MSQPPIPVHDLICQIADQLKKKYGNIPLCTQYAWWALEAITNQNKTTLITHNTLELTDEQNQKLTDWINRQVHENIPLQYLIGSVPFAGCEILVEPPILIPRQETEEWCVALIEKLEQAQLTNIRILDMCTGSGCIAIALAKAFPSALIHAADISDKALRLAQKNIEHNGISNIKLISSDLFASIFPGYDLIVANPPYISQQEWLSLDPAVTQWEDKNALLATDNGLSILRQIITNAPSFIMPSREFEQHHIPQLVVEIGHAQAQNVKTIFENAGFSNVQVTKDLHGSDRIVSGSLDEHPEHTNHCCS